MRHGSDCAENELTQYEDEGAMIPKKVLYSFSDGRNKQLTTTTFARKILCISATRVPSK